MAVSSKRNDNSIVWDFDTISSVFFLILFVGVVAGIFHLTRKGATAAEQTKASLREKGVTIEGSQMRVQTSAVAPSREEYIAKTQRAFERSAAKFAAHPAALTFGRQDGQNSMDPETNGSTGAAVNEAGSSVTSKDVPENAPKKTGMFRRNKAAS